MNYCIEYKSILKIRWKSKHVTVIDRENLFTNELHKRFFYRYLDFDNPCSSQDHTYCFSDSFWQEEIERRILKIWAERHRFFCWLEYGRSWHQLLLVSSFDLFIVCLGTSYTAQKSGTAWVNMWSDHQIDQKISFWLISCWWGWKNIS